MVLVVSVVLVHFERNTSLFAWVPSREEKLYMLNSEVCKNVLAGRGLVTESAETAQARRPKS